MGKLSIRAAVAGAATAFLVVFLTQLESGKLAFIPRAAALQTNCPEPLVKRGGQCVLPRDATLQHTLELAPFTDLNCQGHSLAPDPQNPPALAIFLNGGFGVRIKNCILSGFDFGILAVNAKVPPQFQNDGAWIEEHRIKMLNNTIQANNVPLQLVSVDHAVILENRISHFRKGGVGILARFNSDFNTIKNNEITSAFTSDAKAVTLFPGPVLPSNPNFNTSGGTAGSSILIVESLGPESTVFTSLINGKLHQFAAATSLEVNEDFPGDNLVQGNALTLSYTNRPMDTGILCPNTLRTTIRDNFIQAKQEVRFAIRDGLFGPGTTPMDSRLFPGTCSLNSSRLCVADGDCFIQNFDSASQGTCEGENRPPDLLWRGADTLIEGNTIEGPYIMAGISLAGEDMVVQNNQITGPSQDPASAGILLNGKFPLETAQVTRNTVSHVQNALRIHHVFPLGNFEPASAFLAKVHLNDFSNYERAEVLTSVGYDLPTDLAGNYWGLSCDEGGFDPEKVLDLDGEPINGEDILVFDSQPYGEPVAQAEDLPAICIHP